MCPSAAESPVLILSAAAQHQFHERIAQLVYTFPEDAMTSTGSLFWSAPKRFPHALDFDPKDPAHAHFAQAAAILRAEVYGISRPAWALNAAKVIVSAHAVGVINQTSIFMFLILLHLVIGLCGLSLGSL